MIVSIEQEKTFGLYTYSYFTGSNSYEFDSVGGFKHKIKKITASYQKFTYIYMVNSFSTEVPR